MTLAAAERVGGAIEREIVGADAKQEFETPDDFGDDRFGDRLAVGGELELLEEFESGGDGMGARIVRCLVEEFARFVFGDLLE